MDLRNWMEKSEEKPTENNYLRLQTEKIDLSTIRLIDLMERTNYQIAQVNGQRTYGPPPIWYGDPPSKDSEVFVGRIPRDCFEDELIPVLEKAGFIYEFRLMMDFSGSNRGFGFALYSKTSEALNAITTLDKYEIRNGCYLGIVKSMNNCNLFIGGLEVDVTEEELMGTLIALTAGVSRVTCHLYRSKLPFQRQKKYALVEYETHRAAAMARRVLVPQKMVFRGAKVVVDWASPFVDEHQKSDSKMNLVVPVKSNARNYFGSKNKTAKNEEKLGCDKRASLPPRHASVTQVKQFSSEIDRDYIKHETVLNIPAELYHGPLIPTAAKAGVPTVFQTESLGSNQNNQFLWCSSVLTNQNFDHLVLIPQNDFAYANFVGLQILFSAYQSQMTGCHQQYHPLQYTNRMKEPVILGDSNSLLIPRVNSNL